MAQSFFDEIGAALGGPQSGENDADAKRRAAKWKAYSAYLTIGSSITRSAKALLPLLGVPLVGDLADGLVSALEKSALVAQEGAEGIGAEGERAARALAVLKQDVAAALESLHRAVLAVLDDVDRLTQDEIRLLFQLIKANADFPNIIYLVLAQRDTVVKALDRIAPDRGEAFLEKIVQVGLTVPRIERGQLEKALFAGLDRYLESPSVGQRFDQERWAALYRYGVRPFFENLRDVHRFLSSFGFYVGIFRSENTFEVNPVDLIALDVVRVFVPTVYEALPALKHIITDQPRFMRDKERKEDAATVTALLESVPENLRRHAQNILENVFQPVANVLSNTYYSGADNNWFLELRVCAHQVFDRYFQFSTPTGDISQRELDTVIALVGDRIALASKFTDLKRRGLLEVTLDRLDYYRDKLPIEAATAFTATLFDLDVSDDSRYFLALQFSPLNHLRRIVYSYLRQEPSQDRRKAILQTALASTTGLFTPVKVFEIIDGSASSSRPGSPEPLLPIGSDLDDLRRQLVSLIAKAAKSGRLAADQHLAYLLGAWKRWGGTEDVRQWVENTLVSGQEGLLLILRTLRNTSYEGSLRKERHYYKLPDVEQYVDPGRLSGLIENLEVDRLAEEDAANIRLFREALERRAQGKDELNITDFL